MSDTITIKKHISMCPVCLGDLVAKISVETTVVDARWKDDAPSRVQVTVSAKKVAMALSHECDRRKEAS